MEIYNGIYSLPNQCITGRWKWPLISHRVRQGGVRIEFFGSLPKGENLK
jgi:hypothetical protein